jgi:hypothetical protein
VQIFVASTIHGATLPPLPVRLDFLGNSKDHQHIGTELRQGRAGQKCNRGTIVDSSHVSSTRSNNTAPHTFIYTIYEIEMETTLPSKIVPIASTRSSTATCCPKSCLLDLPVEIFGLIFETIIRDNGLDAAMHLRYVCRALHSPLPRHIQPLTY